MFTQGRYQIKYIVLFNGYNYTSTSSLRSIHQSRFLNSIPAVVGSSVGAAVVGSAVGAAVVGPAVGAAVVPSALQSSMSGSAGPLKPLQLESLLV